MSEVMIGAPFQVWQVRASVDGGDRLMSTCSTAEYQVREMAYWCREVPDGTFEYRYRRADGSYDRESALERMMNLMGDKEHLKRAHPFR